MPLSRSKSLTVHLRLRFRDKYFLKFLFLFSIPQMWFFAEAKQKLEEVSKERLCKKERGSWRFLVIFLLEWENKKKYKTGVINDALGQTYSPTSSDHYLYAIFVLFGGCLRSGDGRTDGRKQRAKLMITTCRDCGSASWIKNLLLLPLKVTGNMAITNHVSNEEEKMMFREKILRKEMAHTTGWHNPPQTKSLQTNSPLTQFWYVQKTSGSILQKSTKLVTENTTSDFVSDQICLTSGYQYDLSTKTYASLVTQNPT